MSKTESYLLRLTESQRALLDEAAEYSGRSIADIVRGGALREARKLLREREDD
ncbi:MAG: DUF1778 domain-containing protein [Myxococcota bacterium]